MLYVQYIRNAKVLEEVEMDLLAKEFTDFAVKILTYQGVSLLDKVIIMAMGVILFFPCIALAVYLCRFHLRHETILHIAPNES